MGENKNESIRLCQQVSDMNLSQKEIGDQFALSKYQTLKDFGGS